MARPSLSPWWLLALSSGIASAHLALALDPTPAPVPAPGGPPCIEKPALHLTPGEQRILRIPGLERLTLGNPAIARTLVRPSGATDSVLLKAVGAGSTDLWARSRGGGCETRPIRIHAVDPKAPPVIPLELGRLLSNLEEVEVFTSSAGALLRGVVRSRREAAAIERIRTLFSATVIDETTLAPDLLETAMNLLEHAAASLEPPGPFEVSQEGGRLLVRGSVENPGRLRSALRTLRDAFPLFDSNLDAMPDSAPTLAFKVYLLEVRRNRFGSLGMDWPSEWAAGFRAFPLRFAGMQPFELRLRALSGEGAARILSEPEISVRAPGEAELFSGGEIPVRTRVQRESKVDWRPFGLSLKLKVEKATASRVRLDVQTEMSALDAATEGQELPRMQTNRLHTQVDGDFGVPLLLTGLIQQGWQESAQGVPLLRSLPVLGALFESEDFRNHQSELVAVLVPRAGPSAAPLERFDAGIEPRGPRPAPRNFVSPEEERDLRSSPDFPWNALGGAGS